MRLGELLLDAVERVLAQLVQHQPRRAVARELAAQLGADRAAGAGDEHGLPADQLGDAGLVEPHRVAAEQVVGLDRAHPLDARAAQPQLAERRHGEHRQAGRRRQLDGAAALRRGGAGQGDDEMGGARDDVFARHVGQRAEHRRAADARAALGRVVVEQAEHRPALRLQAGDEQLRRLARAEHDGAAPGGVAAADGDGDARPRMLVQHAVADAHHDQPHQRHARMQRQHRARHLDQLRHQHRRGGQRAGGQAGPASAGRCRRSPRSATCRAARRRRRTPRDRPPPRRRAPAGRRPGGAEIQRSKPSRNR